MNSLTRLPHETFHSLLILQSLDLRGMFIQNLDEKMFDPLRNLTVMYVFTIRNKIENFNKKETLK